MYNNWVLTATESEIEREFSIHIYNAFKKHSGGMALIKESWALKLHKWESKSKT